MKELKKKDREPNHEKGQDTTTLPTPPQKKKRKSRSHFLLDRKVLNRQWNLVYHIILTIIV